MNTTMSTDSKECTSCRAEMGDLLLAPDEASAAARRHLAACADCVRELAALQAAMAAMDVWTAPEPTPFFDTRLYARLREEIAAAPEGFFERLRSYLTFSTGRQLRPALAGALALVVLISGGTVAGLHSFHAVATTPVTTSATVNDLKIMDNNDQALDQMNQLLTDQDGDDAAPPTS